VKEQGPVAIVSGAGSGMGRAIAHRLAQEGYRLVLIDISRTGLEETQERVQDAAVLEVADVADRQRMFDVVSSANSRFGHVDVLVNAAGILRRASVLEHSMEDWHRTLRVNLDGAFWLSQAFARTQLEADRGGAIVNIASIEAVYPLSNHIAYSTSKGALLMLTKAMALDLAPYGVRVNAVGPGVIATNMNVDLRSDPARSARLLEQIPMGRFGEPDEIAEVVAFLASDRASYMTGAFILVDGGWAIH
jgi:glucose 1-dehydrogenase